MTFGRENGSAEVGFYGDALVGRDEAAQARSVVLSRVRARTPRCSMESTIWWRTLCFWSNASLSRTMTTRGFIVSRAVAHDGIEIRAAALKEQSAGYCSVVAVHKSFILGFCHYNAVSVIGIVDMNLVVFKNRCLAGSLFVLQCT